MTEKFGDVCVSEIWNIRHQKAREAKRCFEFPLKKGRFEIYKKQIIHSTSRVCYIILSTESYMIFPFYTCTHKIEGSKKWNNIYNAIRNTLMIK